MAPTQRDLEREAAMVATLHRIRGDARQYARLYREAHPQATSAQCYRPAIFAAIHAADRGATYWAILADRAKRIHAALWRMRP